MESSEAQRQESSAPSIGEEAEVADVDETPGEQVKQETPQETHRARGSSVSADCGRRSRASER